MWPRRSNPALADLGVVRSRLGLREICRQAWLSLGQRPVRSTVTALGTVVGAAAFTAILGISTTLSHQVSEDFDSLRATEVVVRPQDDTATGAVPADRAAPPGGTETATAWLSDGAVAKLTTLNGVESAGRRVHLGRQTVRRGAALDSASMEIPVMGVEPAALAVIEPALLAGRAYDRFHEDSGAPVALVPRSVATRLHIARPGAAIFIGPRPVTVVGVFGDVARREDALASVLVPYATAEAWAPGVSSRAPEHDIVVEVAPGAASTITAQAPFALQPDDPRTLRAIGPPDPETFRHQVDGDVERLALLLGLVALVVGTVIIAGSGTAGVLSRMPEIGLRRALGARPHHIFLQLLAESSLLGAAGGAAGAVIGLAVTVAVAMWHRWAASLDLPGAALACALGATAGLLAGVAPAVRATRIEPVAALRR